MPDYRKMGVGDFVELNSGSPPLLIVDVPDHKMIVVAWCTRGGEIIEDAMPRLMVHRISRGI